MRQAVGVVVLLIGLSIASSGCAGRTPVGLPPQTSQEAKDKAVEVAARAQRAADRGKTDDAIALYEEALRHDDTYAPAWNNLGVLYWKQGRRQDAVRAFNLMAALAPADARPVMNIGAIYLELGYAQEALRHFEEALERDPNNLDALRLAIRAAADLDMATEQLSEWIARALMREQDPQYFDYLQNQRARVEGRLEAERRRAHGRTING